jgi:hypothetical protein
MSTLTGQCLCGAVGFSMTGPFRDVALCHCGQCRRWHGHVGAYTDVARDRLKLTESRGLAWFRSSGIARRGFCRECGSSLFWDGDGRDTISVAVGAIDGATGLRTTLQIYTRDKGDYYELDQRVPSRDPSNDRDARKA